MNHQFQIVFKSYEQNFYCPYYKEIKTFDFSHEQERVFELIESYGQDWILCLAELISDFRQNSDIDSAIKDVSQLNEDQLRENIQNILAENEHLQSAKQQLEKKVNELSQTKTNKEVVRLRDDIKQLKEDIKNVEDENRKLNDALYNEQNRSSKYQKGYTEYFSLFQKYNDLIGSCNALQNQVSGIPQITQENEKLKKSKQELEKRFQEIEQELQETQQKLSLAWNRLRSINVNPNLAGGGSRSDQLKNEFSQLKTTLFYEASTKILYGWREQGFQLTFKSEEFAKIKSILSKRVFGDGMAYFAKDKSEIDAELHLIMDVLLDIEDFNSLSSPSFQKIQERIQVGLLHFKGIDNSDEALIKYVEDVTKVINQDLQQIANLKTTGEALNEIRKFAESGLRLVRDIVNDPNSGELFIPELGATFDERSHDTKDEHKGQIKMTIYPGYRVAGNVLVKADVITHETESILKKNELTTSDSSEHNGRNSINEQSPSQAQTQENDKSQDLAEPMKSSISESINFKGKLTCPTGLNLLSNPCKDSTTGSKIGDGEALNFEGWTVGEPWDEPHKESGSKWYKLAGQDFWLPACYINGEPPSDLLAMNSGR